MQVSGMGDSQKGVGITIKSKHTEHVARGSWVRLAKNYFVDTNPVTNETNHTDFYKHERQQN